MKKNKEKQIQKGKSQESIIDQDNFFQNYICSTNKKKRTTIPKNLKQTKNQNNQQLNNSLYPEIKLNINLSEMNIYKENNDNNTILQQKYDTLLCEKQQKSEFKSEYEDKNQIFDMQNENILEIVQQQQNQQQQKLELIQQQNLEFSCIKKQKQKQVLNSNQYEEETQINNNYLEVEDNNNILNEDSFNKEEDNILDMVQQSQQEVNFQTYQFIINDSNKETVKKKQFKNNKQNKKIQQYEIKLMGFEQDSNDNNSINSQKTQKYQNTNVNFDSNLNMLIQQDNSENLSENSINKEIEGVNQMYTKIPDFAISENIRDSQGRKSDDPNYDPSTLFIPEEQIKGMTGYLRQYWLQKADNFDRILLVRRGRFFDALFQDSVIVHQVLDYEFQMKKLKIGIPAHSIRWAIQKLLQNNYSVAICEQIETEQQQKIRIQQEKKYRKGQQINYVQKKDDEVMKREVTVVHNRGIAPLSMNIFNEKESTYFPDQEDNSDNTRYQKQQIGYLGNNFVCFFNINSDFQLDIIIYDSFLNKVIFSQFQENFKNNGIKMQKLKNLMHKYPPQQIIIDLQKITEDFNALYDIQQLFSSLPSKPQICKPTGKQFSIDTVGQQIYNLFQDNNMEIPQILMKKAVQYQPSNESQDKQQLLFLETLCIFMQYLKRNLLLEKVLPICSYFLYNTNDQQELNLSKEKQINTKKMILDQQTLEHLDITNVIYGSRSNSVYSKKYQSLLQFIDHTCTQFGKRELKNWLINPLVNSEDIIERQLSIIDLQTIPGYLEQFKVYMRRLPDLEKIINRLYLYTIQQQDVITYGDINSQRLRELKKIFIQCELIYNQLIENIQKQSYDFKSQRLKNLVTPNAEENGLLPDILNIIKNIEDNIEWRGQNKENPVPIKGLCKSYDLQYQVLLDIEDEFDQYLEKIQNQFGGDKRIKYCHAKYEYQLEFPVDILVNQKKPDNFEFTSKRFGHDRFYTEEIKQLIQKQSIQSDILREKLSEFTIQLFRQFHKYKDEWDQFIFILKELDCLISLNTVSFQEYDESSMGKFTKPEIIQSDENTNQIQQNQSYVDIQSGIHPCVAQTVQKMVSNDISLNVPEKSNQAIFITGCNMGGKSTVMRTLAVNVILAQLGCYVPCKKLVLKPFTKLMTRMGANDNLNQNKSTFYVEMEEACNIVNQSDSQSLVLIDELGRGTEANDGNALAFSIIKNLILEKKCNLMFATHSHILLDEFKNKNQQFFKNKISFYKMDTIIDDEEDVMIFLYKLSLGSEDQSFASKILQKLDFPKEIQINQKFHTILNNIQSKRPMNTLDF